MRKFKTLIIVLIISICCMSIVFAENSTDDVKITNDSDNTSDIDIKVYNILINSISGNEIKFSDESTGYCIDSAKDPVKKDDRFKLGSLSNDKNENYVKLAIIECYKQGKENDIGKIISKIMDGDLDENDEVIKEIINSNEKITDESTAEIDNTTEATFEFEILTPENSSKSDCLAYKVTFKTIEKENQASSKNTSSKNPDVLGTTNDEQENQTNNSSDEKQSENQTNSTGETERKDNASETNETNKTVVNKTNTIITIENNTTIIHKNNVKEVNNTTPADNTANDFLKVAGNPIFILVIVIAVIVAVTVIKRKD